MKKMIQLSFLILPLAGFSQQGLLHKLKDKAKARGEQRIEEGMDKAIDKAEESTKKHEGKKAPEISKGAQSKSDTGVTPLSTTREEAASTSFKIYSKYDFIPGERIVYTEDFSQDKMGELPTKWNTNNRGETVRIESLPGNWLQLFTSSRFASPAVPKLPENFTMEMDLLFHFSGEGGYAYPQLEIKLLELISSDATANNFVTSEEAAKELIFGLTPDGPDHPMIASLRTFDNGSEYFTGSSKGLKDAPATKHFHVSVWVQKSRVRCWVNGDKVFDMPKAVPDAAVFNRIGFGLESSMYTPEQFSIFVSNIKIAEGTPDMRSKLLTEGKLVTTGILFDVASDKIKPESAGVLKEIAEVLKENASLNVKIVGHTDSDGEDAKNLDLSKRRAAAVKNALIKEFGIGAGRMQFDGLGESKPVADNESKEGKAKNRRVEFIKL